MSSRISFDEALTTMRSMFPGVDDQVLINALRRTGGHMERSIDLLLRNPPLPSATTNTTAAAPPQSAALPADFLSLDEANDRPEAPRGDAAAPGSLESDVELARRLQAQLDAEAIAEQQQRAYQQRLERQQQRNNQRVQGQHADDDEDPDGVRAAQQQQQAQQQRGERQRSSSVKEKLSNFGSAVKGGVKNVFHKLTPASRKKYQSLEHPSSTPLNGASNTPSRYDVDALEVEEDDEDLDLDFDDRAPAAWSPHQPAGRGGARGTVDAEEGFFEGSPRHPRDDGL